MTKIKWQFGPELRWLYSKKHIFKIVVSIYQDTAVPRPRCIIEIVNVYEYTQITIWYDIDSQIFV